MSHQSQSQAIITECLTVSNGPVSDFNPRPEDPCFCGSDKIFSTCCGSMEVERPAPYGVHIFENFLTTDMVCELTDYADQCDGERLMMIDNERSTPENIVRIADERRIAERVTLGDHWHPMNAMVRETFIDLAKQCFGVTLDWYETPDLMRYRAGGHYVRHADNANMDMASQLWSKVIDRDLSLLLYLNDDFDGGELHFCKFNFRLRPRAGTVVIFPSDHRYMHQAETVTRGVRYAIVSWASVNGIPKIAEAPTACAIRI